MTYRAKCARRRETKVWTVAHRWPNEPLVARAVDFMPSAQVARRAKVRRSHAETPYVCPSCYAVGGEPCAFDCSEAERRRALAYDDACDDDFDDLEDDFDDEDGAA